jgi:hypothetical protein
VCANSLSAEKSQTNNLMPAALRVANPNKKLTNVDFNLMTIINYNTIHYVTKIRNENLKRTKCRPILAK